jgi:serine/threonine protein kinase/tetratricopeptide (TPR) repeat protein
MGTDVPTAGQQLGHYRILEKIGAGGMGVVFRARDERLDRDVAVKVLPPGSLSDEAARKRFRKEAHALSRLNHANIETIYDFDSQDGVDFLVMEYVAGVTIDKKLALGPLPEKEVLAIGEQIARALEEAHEYGIIHRDLKPGNIAVTAKGRVKVLDFGLAKLVQPATPSSITESLTEASALAGTIPYMAPEQLRGEPSDFRSDIYALGAVLYELATANRPFDEKLSTALVDDIIHRPVVPPRRLNPKLSPRLDDLILKCLEKEPENRYQSAKELTVDMRRLGVSAVAPLAVEVRHRSQYVRYALIAGGLALALIVMVALLNFDWRGRFRTGAASPRIDSLAVLPLANLSDDPQQLYFADGMTDALIANLAKIGALRVISRTSVMQYQSTRKPLPQIARELNVDAVVEGSVQRSGNRVRVTARLIQATDDRHLWGKIYERDLRDVLSLESELAQAIASEIRVKVTPQEQKLLAKTRPVNPESHEAYLKGIYYFNDGRDHLGSKRSKESFQKSVAYLQQAIQIDPNYAQAYAQLARTYDWTDPTPVAQSRVAASKALELDETLAEAHGALAWEMLRFDREWGGAEREFKRAIELNPGYGEAHHGYALFLLLMQRLDEAIAEINTALLLDPLTLPQKINAARIYVCARQYDQSIQQLRTTLTLNPNNFAAHLTLGKILLGKAMHAEGIAEVQKSAELTERSTVKEATLALAYALSGRQAEASRLVARLAVHPERETAAVAAHIAAAYVALGDKTDAFVWLEKAFEENPIQMGWELCFKPLDGMRSDPRTQKMLRSSGLPP